MRTLVAVIAISVAAVVWLATAGVAESATLYVPNQYSTIQAAINAANNGDTVIVKPTGSPYKENIHFADKAITVKSEQGPEKTIIDGQQKGSVVVFHSAEGPNSVLDGFTITNGSGTYQPGHDYAGGGIYISAYGSVWQSGPTIINNIIIGNSVTGSGGGIFGDEIYGLIKNNTIANNSAASGGGIYLIDIRPSNHMAIEGNNITGNTAIGEGGGICAPWVYGVIDIENNIIKMNTSGSSGGGILSWQIGDGVATFKDNNLQNNTAVFGGGIYCAFQNLTISGNVITENAAKSAGGIYAKNCGGIISYNTISKNTALNQPNSEGLGGGILCNSSSPTILYNTISENKATNWGGGICSKVDTAPYYSVPIIDSNLIFKNSTDLNYNGSRGGGIACDNTYDPHPVIRNNIIAENASYEGGGIGAFATAPQITNNLFFKNSATTGGGGVDLYFCHTEDTIPFINNSLIGNIAGQFGGGIRCFRGITIAVTNSIFWNNVAPQGPEIMLEGDIIYNPTNMAISYSDVKGGQSQVYCIGDGVTLNWGSGMLDTDPLFCAVSEDDYHLTYNSPCKETGDVNAPDLSTTDFEGDPRILGAFDTVSMGADEYHWHLYSTGTPVPNGDIKIKIVGIPLTAPTTLLLGNGVLEQPLPTQYGDFYLVPPLYPFDVGAIPPSGILLLDIVVPGSAPSGYLFPLQAIAIDPQSSSYYKLTNLLKVEVE